MLNRRLSVLLSSLFLCLICANLQANTVIVSSSPPPSRESDTPPRGYQRCHMAPAGANNGHWHNRHRVCYYPGGVWISGYWECMRFKPRSGVCMNWGWVPSHWDRHPVAYGQPVPVVRPGPVIMQPAPVVVQPVPVAVAQPVIQPILQVSLGNDRHHHGHH